ncbi:hypothetical protein G4177_26195 [Corallococcus sp. ZKHCc1 1396]|uniref:Transmembrane protein n=1 Tax=Corallococcus soli TaxID=2710757 RepID=A0ABR9PUS4_9BACT|nr:hypothetical protein [Corallococcus soli]MBE4751669.1 hypothetical protein [Corallococcus soli]
MASVKTLGLWLLVLVAEVGCGAIARDMAKQGTEGALETIQEQKAQKTPEEQATDDAVARRNAEQAARGMLDAVTQPERPPSAPLAASPEVPPPGSLPGPGSALTGPGIGGSGSFSSSLATQVARGLTAELGRQLGPDGSGPLGRSLSATAGRMAGSMVEQSRDELGSVFPECEGLQGAQAVDCRDATLGRLGGAFSQGVAGGLMRSFQPWLLALTFVGGLLVGLLLFLSFSVARLRRESSVRQELLRERRHA